VTAVERLKDVPLLSCLSNRELKRVARNVRENHFVAGTSVVREGMRGRFGFFILEEGEASVSVGGNEVARLHPGDHFGELSLISESVRTATVTALTPITCFVIEPWDFRDLVKGSPETAWKLLQHVADLLDEERGRAKSLTPASSP
jgi:CRP/FNR family transcriptional regulator, cyclic AMP receptor protein